MDTDSLFNRFLNSLKEWDTWHGFRNICFLGFLLITVFDIFGANFFNKIFNPQPAYRSFYFLLSYIGPFFIYLVIFSVRRLYLRLMFSKKINVVFAYNLEGTELDRFSPEYNRLINQLKNEINAHSLGKKIKVITCPPDIKLREKTAAEAKAMLALPGSTLLIWGHVERKRGVYKFNTLFSYEFGYPKGSKKEDAKQHYEEFIQKILGRGLFSANMGIDNFNDQLLPTIYFILGSCAFSLALLDQAETLFESFKEVYRGEDIVRQRDLGPALIEVNDFLISIYIGKIGRLFRRGDENMDEIKSLADKTILIERGNYDANIMLAFYYANIEDWTRAEDYTRIAGNNSGSRGQHAHLFNRAFLFLQKGEYDNALNEYQSVQGELTVNIVQLSDYLGKKYDSTGNTVFQFAYGYINFCWGDVREGKKYLKSFLGKESTKQQLFPLTEEAKRLITS